MYSVKLDDDLYWSFIIETHTVTVQNRACTQSAEIKSISRCLY